MDRIPEMVLSPLRAKTFNLFYKVILVTALLIFSLNAISKTEILLQGFNWESYKHPKGWYNHLQTKVNDIQNLGFTQIWLPPPTYSYDGEGIYPNSRGYIPLEYYNLNSSYGNKDQLKRLVHSFKEKNISPIADLVINHRGKHAGSSESPIFRSPDWNLSFFTGGPGMPGLGNPDTGSRTDYAYDLDFTSPEIVDYLSNWMNWLKREIGFVGFRYDFAKGYAPKYVGTLNKRTDPEISIGEYWTNMNFDCNGLCYNQNRHRQKVMNWIDNTWKKSALPSNKASSAFDFTTKGILQVAVKTNEFWRLADSKYRPPGAIGLWPKKSYTFIDNHDTGSTQNHWPFGNREEILQGYVYTLTHPGIPSVFWDHLYHTGLYHEIKTLMNLRLKHNIEADCELNIIHAKKDLYVAEINDSVIIKLGPISYFPEKGYRAILKGYNFIVFEKE